MKKIAEVWFVLSVPRAAVQPQALNVENRAEVPVMNEVVVLLY
jgi:hypothetical protein